MSGFSWPASGVATALLAFAAASLAVPTGVRAQPAGGDEARVALSEGRRRYADLDFDAAVEALRRALAAPGLSEAERLEALEYLGCAYVVLERNDSARSAFGEMLRLDPYRVLREPTGSPRIRSFVDRLRARLVPDAALDERVVVRIQAPRRMRSGERARVRVEIRGPLDVASATLTTRHGDAEARTIPMRGDARRFEASVAAARAGEDVELWVVVRDASGRVLARGGEPSVPVRVEVLAAPARPPAVESRSILSRWWFWATTAAVVASGVVVGLAVAGGDEAPDGTLSPGRVEIR